MNGRLPGALFVLVLFVGSGLLHGSAALEPNVLIVTVDTLRADRMSAYGYTRNTSPHLDRWIGKGVRFDQARTVEPLTSPALCSMLTSRYPHESGASRNGLRLRPGLNSLPKMLQSRGYRTAAFVSNWTLRHKISGLGEHFEHFGEVLKGKRWLGLISAEATADDVNDSALAWLAEHRRTFGDRPYLLWVHYSEPHAPYRLHKEFLPELGITKHSKIGPADRYDTEIADVDRSIGEFLATLDKQPGRRETLMVFTSDHGESLGEHDYWGHGRHLYEPTLHIPMALHWPERLEPRVIDAPALNLDLAPTIVGLLGIESPVEFRGYDWTPVLEGAAAPVDRITAHQAHRGAVISRHDSEIARRSGLLSVALVQNRRKEILHVKKKWRHRFDLQSDPGELIDLPVSDPALAEGLEEWMQVVDRGLGNPEDEPPQPLDEETIEQLRALGYAD